MATDPSKNDDIWKGVCEKEMMTWMSPQKQIQSIVANQAASGQVPPSYRVPMPGDPVTITNMRRRPELNGARGEIVSSALDEFGRVTVKVFDSTVPGVGSSKKMKIQPVRLVPMRSSSVPALTAMGNMSDAGSSVRSFSRGGSVVSAASGRRLGSAISSGAREALRSRGMTPLPS